MSTLGLPLLESLFDEVVVETERVHEEMRRITYTDARRSDAHEALVHCCAASVRLLRAGQSLISSGWTPECGALFRAVYEYARDAAYILSLRGDARAEAGGQYLIARLSRSSPHFLKGVDSDGASFVEATRRQAPAKSTDPGQHWSGKDKRQVERTARAHWKRTVGEFDEFFLKDMAFGFGSSIAHADPGAWLMYRLSEASGRIELGPMAYRAQNWFLVGINVGVLVYATVGQRTRSGDTDRIERLMDTVYARLHTAAKGSAE